MRPIDIAAPLASLMAPEIGEIGPLHRLCASFGGPARCRSRSACAISARSCSARICSASSSRSADDFVGRPHVVDLRALRLLDLEQAVDAVERDAPIVADDAAAAIGVGQAGDDAGLAAAHDLRRVGVEHARRCGSCGTS